MTLDGKTAIVTGGSTAVGMAIMLELARAGAHVVSDHVARLAVDPELAFQVHALGSRALSVKADVSRHDDLKRIMVKAVATFGSIDILVNAAAIESRTSILTTTVTRFDHVMAVNIRSAVFATQLAAQQMIVQDRGGSIINISSLHEDLPMPGNIAFCMSKGAMRMLTRTAALELAPHRILVVGVAPGSVAAPIRESSGHDPDPSATSQRTEPFQHLARPGDVAGVVGWAVGPAGRSKTGTTIVVDDRLRRGDLGM